MMKRRLFLIVLLTCFVFCQRVLAEDGALKIDTNLTPTQEKSTVSYIEQESDLDKLFKSETTERVEDLKVWSDQLYTESKTHLFLEEIKTANIVEHYQPLLFTPDTMIKSRDDYGVVLYQESHSISWQIVGLGVLGLSVTVFTLIRSRKGTGEIK